MTSHYLPITVLTPIGPYGAADTLSRFRLAPFAGMHQMDTMFNGTVFVPRHEATDNEEMFQVSIDLPGVKREDITVELVEEGNKVLIINGDRCASTATSTFSSKFCKSFSLDSTVESDKLEAKFENGVLTVGAPKDMSRQNKVRKIPITPKRSESDSPSEAATEVHANTLKK